MKTRMLPTHQCSEGCNPYEVIRQLKTATLVIHTIPGEEWALSCARHKTLLVDIYTLVGAPASTGRRITFRCGRLSENLLKLLYYKRRVQYYPHEVLPAGANIDRYVRPDRRLADTLEEDFLIRQRGGDLLFCLIPGERWRLTATCFGRLRPRPFAFFRLVEEATLGTEHPRLFSGTSLEYVLLSFLCLETSWQPHQEAAKIVELRSPSADTAGVTAATQREEP